MKGALKSRFDFLFRSTKGLVLVAIASISIVTLMFGMLSGPMEAFGIKAWMVDNLGLRLIPKEREGRILMLYHSIAQAVIAIEVYLITHYVPMRRRQRSSINATITVGYLLTLVFGLVFGYFGRNFLAHGVAISGMVIVFASGVMLTVALWPWSSHYLITDPELSRTRGGLDLERVAFFLMALATLGSALFGAAAGMNFGNGFQTFLTEDTIREPVKTPLQLAVIGHLHIMLTLIAVALTLILGRAYGFRGRLHKVAMPLMIVGTLIITGGVWSVVVTPMAHVIINVGSMPVLAASLLLVWFGWRQQSRRYVAGRELAEPTRWQRFVGIIHDPLRFGTLFQMVYMNVVVTAVGIFMAVNLRTIIREWTSRDERITLTGHWHVLSGIIATIILLHYADMMNLRGRARQILGWSVLFFSNLAFSAVALYETKRLYVSELQEQPLIDGVMLLTDIGLAMVLTALGVLMAWRLVDLFRSRGTWSRELAQDPPPPSEEEVRS